MTMRAITQDTYGSADVLQLTEVERPVPGADEVLVRVHAAGVDRGVWHLMAGIPYLMRFVGFGLRAPKQRIRGMDLAGRVEAVGARVTRFKPGDLVYGAGDGSFADYACAREGSLARKPANLDFTEAAAVPISAITALRALRDVGKVQPGHKVLVIGAAGGVGTFAVQLAKAFGASVTGVCSTGKQAFVRSIGADDVIDYTREDFADRRGHYDLILDIAGNRPIAHLRRALAPKGTLVLVGGEDGDRFFGPLGRTLWALILSLFIGQKLRGLLALTSTADLEFLTGLIEAGELRPVVERTYPLGEAPDAIRRMTNGQARGKLVVSLDAA